MKKGLQSFLIIVVLFLGTTVHSKTASEIFDTVSSSVVVIRTYDAKGNDQGLGSGVVLASDVIATNCHVIKDVAKIQVVYKGKQYLATLQYTDWDRDVCTLAVSGISTPAVVKGSTSRLKVGARVYAIGAPRGLELTLSEGIISSIREVDGGQYLQISAPISPGSSGGGLFDEEGQLIVKQGDEVIGRRVGSGIVGYYPGGSVLGCAYAPGSYRSVVICYIKIPVIKTIYRAHNKQDCIL